MIKWHLSTVFKNWFNLMIYIFIHLKRFKSPTVKILKQRTDYIFRYTHSII